MGRKIFHVKAIRWSYRIRGRVPRVQINREARARVERRVRGRDRRKVGGPVKNKALVRRAITKILAYSAIKISANLLLPYSMLNPETSSDSPSAKSKGVRLVSARREISQMRLIRGTSKRGHVRWVCLMN